MRNVDTHDAVFDERIVPDSLEQLAPRNDAPRVSHQGEENVVGFWFEIDPAALTRQLPAGNIQRELAELVHLAGRHRT